MDFTKLKRTAAETIRRAAKPIVEDEEPQENEKVTDESDDVSTPAAGEEDTSSVGTEDNGGATDDTINFNLKNVLERFRKKKEDLDKTFRDIFAVEDMESDAKVEEEQSDERQDGYEATKGSETDVCRTGDSLKGLAEKITVFEGELAAINETLTTVKDNAEYNNRDTLKSIDRIMDRFDETYGKLNDISATIAGVSKLNDSIFDLKNTLVNMRNTESELQTAFLKLKKKMTTGVTIISILAAIVVILEVIGLLS